MWRGKTLRTDDGKAWSSTRSRQQGNLLRRVQALDCNPVPAPAQRRFLVTVYRYNLRGLQTRASPSWSPARNRAEPASRKRMQPGSAARIRRQGGGIHERRPGQRDQLRYGGRTTSWPSPIRWAYSQCLRYLHGRTAGNYVLRPIARQYNHLPRVRQLRPAHGDLPGFRVWNGNSRFLVHVRRRRQQASTTDATGLGGISLTMPTATRSVLGRTGGMPMIRNAAVVGTVTVYDTEGRARRLGSTNCHWGRPLRLRPLGRFRLQLPRTHFDHRNTLRCSRASGIHGRSVRDPGPQRL